MQNNDANVQKVITKFLSMDGKTRTREEKTMTNELKNALRETICVTPDRQAVSLNNGHIVGHVAPYSLKELFNTPMNCKKWVISGTINQASTEGADFETVQHYSKNITIDNLRDIMADHVAKAYIKHISNWPRVAATQEMRPIEYSMN